MCNINPMVATDSYKCSHWCQFPKGTRKMSYYLEARKGDVVFFGLQAIIKEYLRQPDFTQLTNKNNINPSKFHS
jgi:nicotinic acid phosphoribosyltransferase